MVCRYEEMATRDANSKKDWSRAEQYYYQAVDVLPEGKASPWSNSIFQLTLHRDWSEAQHSKDSVPVLL